MKIGKVSSLYIYPMKSMSAQPLESVEVSPERGFPYDRMFALAHHNADCLRTFSEPLQPEFFQLTDEYRLAGLRTRCDPTTGHFEIFVQEHLVLAVDLMDKADRLRAEQFFARVLDLPNEKTPVIAHAQNYNYSYLDGSSCHVVNLASVRDLSERAGVEIDPLRFRANLYIDTDEPWAEFEWMGRDVAIGHEVRVRPSKRAARCAATEINRVSTVRDLPIPRLLKRFYGHTDFGVYASISQGGLLQPGMTVELAPAHGRNPHR